MPLAKRKEREEVWDKKGGVESALVLNLVILKSGEPDDGQLWLQEGPKGNIFKNCQQTYLCIRKSVFGNKRQKTQILGSLNRIIFTVLLKNL